MRTSKQMIEQSIEKAGSGEPWPCLEQAMWRADVFARRVLGEHSAAAIYAQAYPGRSVPGWMKTRHLRHNWAGYGLLPAQWSISAIKDLLAELEACGLDRFTAHLRGLAYRRAFILAEAALAA